MKRKKLKKVIMLSTMLALFVIVVTTVYAATKSDVRTLDLTKQKAIRNTTKTKIKSKKIIGDYENYIDIQELLSNKDVQSNVPKPGKTATGTFIADNGNGNTYIYKVSCDKDGDGNSRYCTIAMELLRLKDPYKYNTCVVDIQNDDGYYPGEYHGRESYTIFGEEYVRDRAYSKQYGDATSIPYAYPKKVDIYEEGSEYSYKNVQYVDYKVKDPENDAYSIDYKIFCIDNIIELLKESSHNEWAAEIEAAMQSQSSYAFGFSPIFTYTGTR